MGSQSMGEDRTFSVPVPLGQRTPLDLLPAARDQGLRGGVKYWDGQFNDARLALTLARTAAAHGALLVNYCRACDLLFDAGKVAGLVCEDVETGQSFHLQSRCVINATGVWVDHLRQVTRMLQEHFAPLMGATRGFYDV